MVLCHGEIMGIVHASKTTKEEIGLMMTGAINLTEEKADKNFDPEHCTRACFDLFFKSVRALCRRV